MDTPSFFGWTLARISLVNWSGFVLDDIDLSRDNTLITAPNGTGKTAIFDAYSVCVGGGKSQDVDQSRDKNSRTALGYILGTYQGGIMRESAVGFVGLMFENRAKNKKVSLVVRMAGRAGDAALTEMNSLIALDTDISTKDMLVDNCPMDWTDFYDAIKKKSGGKTRAYSRNQTGEFRAEFLDQVTPAGRTLKFKNYQKLMTMMKLGVGTKGDFKEESFIRKHIIDTDSKIDLGRSRDSIAELQKNIARNEVFQTFIQQVIELDEVTRSASELEAEYNQKKAELEHSQNIELLKGVFKAEHDEENLNEEKVLLSERIQETQKRRDYLVNRNAELKNSKAAILIERKKNDLKYVLTDIEKKSKEIAALQSSIEGTRQILSAIGMDYDTITEAQLEDKKLQLDDTITEATAFLTQKKSELTEIENTIRQLKSGDAVSTSMMKISDRVHERCRDQGIDATPLYQLIDSVDSKYALAIETVLGNQRFAMIPKTTEDYYSAKRAVYENNIIVVMPSDSDYAKSGSLAEHIHTSDSRAQSFLNYRLGGLFPMGDTDRKGDNTIALEPDEKGVLKRFASRYTINMTPVRPSEFVLGKASQEEIDREIFHLAERFGPLGDEVRRLEANVKNDKVVYRHLDRIVLGNDLDDLEADLREFESQQTILEEEISALESENESLAELAENEKELAGLNKSSKVDMARRSEIDKTLGSLVNRISSLRERFRNSSVVSCPDMPHKNDDEETAERKLDEVASYEQEYFDLHKDIEVSRKMIEELSRQVDAASTHKRKLRLKLSEDNTTKYSEFPDIFNQCLSVVHAAADSDGRLFKEVDDILKNEGVQSREEIDQFAKNNEAMEAKLREHVKETYLKEAYSVISDIRRSMRGLNSSIKGVKLHNGQYSFAYTPHNERKRWIELVESYTLGSFDITSEEEKATFNEIVNTIVESDGDSDPRLDPISWFKYQIKVTVEGKTMTLDEWKGGGSGGMKKVPGYIALLGAVKSMTTVSKSEAGPTVLFIDEAFEQIDSKNSAGLVDMYKAAGIQTVYLTNSSNFPKTSVSQIINMYPNANGDRSVVVDCPIVVKEPAQDMTRKAMSTVVEQGSLL